MCHYNIACYPQCCRLTGFHGSPDKKDFVLSAILTTKSCSVKKIDSVVLICTTQENKNVARQSRYICTNGGRKLLTYALTSMWIYYTNDGTLCLVFTSQLRYFAGLIRALWIDPCSVWRHGCHLHVDPVLAKVFYISRFISSIERTILFFIL